MTEQTHGTGIEWTHVPGYKGETWNPVRGCTKVSPGCKFCYAETFAERWRGIPGHAYEQGFDLRLAPWLLPMPLRHTKPRAYFVNSMSDLFQAGVENDYIAACIGVMAATPGHIYMTLTKRADRMLHVMQTLTAMRSADNPWKAVDYAWNCARDLGVPTTGPGFRRDLWPLPNAWMGVSVEDRKYGLPRIDILRQVPATVRFLSIEPLLEDLGPLDLTGVHWVIVGGESGPGARWFSTEWLENIVAQCKAQGVSVFVKQLGAHPGRPRLETLGGGLVPLRLNSRKGSDESEWPAHLRGIKQFPKIVRAA